VPPKRFVFLLSIALPYGEACADANIAAIPASVEYRYPDGSWTRMSCVHSEAEVSQCEFILKLRHSRKRRFKFEITRDRSPHFIDSYSFWPESGGAPLSVRIDADCLDSEVAEYPDSVIDESECKLMLRSQGDRLVQDFVEVWSGGRSMKHIELN
jgi:hypothetical protein